MSKRIIALFLSLCLILSAAPAATGAATGQQVTAGAVTVTAGNTASVTLRAENFDSIAALDVYVFYDPAVFTVSSTYNGSMLSGAQTSVNTGESGKITLSAMSLNGISGSGNLITIYFNTSATAEPGTYPITVAIGRAYNSSLQPVTVGGVSGSVTLNKPVETQPFTIHSYTDKSTLRKGDVLSCRIANGGWNSFVSGEFTVEYDHEIFALDSVDLDPSLLGEGAVYSVNPSISGQVRIAYANSEPVDNFYLFTVKLKVIADADTTTSIKTRASNMYRPDLSAYLPGSYTSTVTIQKMPAVTDYPNVFFQTEELEVGTQSKSLFCLEAGAGIAAADFTLTYDPTILRCVSVVMAEGVTEQGGMLVINDNYAEGAIRFSYVNMSAYDAEDLPLVEITWEPLRSPQSHYEIVPQAVGVVDEDQNLITLEYVVDSGCIFAPYVTPPTCTEDGFTSHTCSACGKTYEDSPVGALGHEYEATVTEPTCVENGYTTYTCICGDSYVSDIVTAQGHSYESVVTPPTCENEGFTTYTCHCGDTYVDDKVPALGHTYKSVTTDATCTVDGSIVYTCHCGDTYTEVIPAAGHKHTASVTPPTCESEGFTTYTCHCGDSYVDDHITALGHTQGEAIAENETAATCTKDGGYDTVVYCSVCQKELSRTTTVIPATGHHYVDGMCGCGAVIVVIGNGISYTVSSQTITVTCHMPCSVGYWDETTAQYIAIPATANADGSYSFTAPDSALKILIVIKGDTNDDGRISAPDVARLNAHLLGKFTMTAEELFTADVNGDGNVDEADMLYLSDAILGIGSAFLDWTTA